MPPTSPPAGPAPNDAVTAVDGVAAIGRRRALALLARPLGLHAASRVVVVAGAAVAALVQRPDLTVVRALMGWDSGWYLHLARDGYPGTVPLADGGAAQSTLGFFPLFPLVVRLVVRMTGASYEVAGLLVGGTLGVLASVAVWLLTRRVAGTAVADRTVALFCFFPGSFVLSMPYAEGLLITLAAACLLALVERRWLLAGLLAALATATRPNGVALVVACAWVAGGTAWRERSLRPLPAPLLAPTGLLVFAGYLHLHTGDAGAYLRTQREGWKQNVDPLSTMRVLGRFLRDPLVDVNDLVLVAGLAFLAVTVPLLLRSRLPGPLIAYCAAVLAIALTTEAMGARPRFLLTAFPLLIVVARRLNGPGFSVVLGSLAALLGAFTVLSLATMAATP